MKFMEQELLEKLEKGELVCDICKLIIPLTPKKGPKYTITSFTIVDGKPVCYRDYHPDDFEKISR
jgi:hypothetical protein